MRFVTVCLEPGCPELVSTGRCKRHAREYAAKYEGRYHDNPWRWIYGDPRWAALRLRVRQEQIECAWPLCVRRWTDLDHIRALQDGGAPFDRRNVQGLCKRHHSTKTAEEIHGRAK